MTNDQWGALVASLKRVANDIRTNAPLPENHPANGGILAFATKLESELPAAEKFLADHQGAETGLADFLGALDGLGVPYVGMIREAVLDEPEVVAEIEKFLPTVVWLLSATQPAATGITGDLQHPWGER